MIEIRKANENDIPKIARLEEECFSAPWSEKAVLETMQREESIFLVAIKDGVVAGYIGSYFCHPEGYITNVAVSSDFRRQGIGRSLIEKLIRCGEERELSFWTLEVRESNAAAISLYASLGFENVGRRPRFYTNPEEAAELMTYYIDASAK